ncbi:MAG: lysozyme inhibitor LprI family protein [Methylotenera sp.]|nr:lysozyme inhibitor LprI family protein [Methylotenera sp.]MDD4925411.1 lysozyme inhibitor LprI family protein [Methylotenera sp.]
MKKIALLILMLANIGYAAEKNNKDLCANQCAQCDQTTMNICAYDHFKNTDAELNNLYKKLTRESTTDKLRIAQRAWIKYRDAQCDYEASDFDDGSMQPTIHSSCLAELTKQRIKELDNQI